MAMRKVKSKTFALKKEASAWAKKEKSAYGPDSGTKWEVVRNDNPERPWSANIFRNIT